MKLFQVSQYAAKARLIERMSSILAKLDELDAAPAITALGERRSRLFGYHLLNDDIDPLPTAETAKKVRALLRVDLTDQRATLLQELTNAGISE